MQWHHPDNYHGKDHKIHKDQKKVIKVYYKDKIPRLCKIS